MCANSGSAVLRTLACGRVFFLLVSSRPNTLNGPLGLGAPKEHAHTHTHTYIHTRARAYAHMCAHTVQHGLQHCLRSHVHVCSVNANACLQCVAVSTVHVPLLVALPVLPRAVLAPLSLEPPAALLCCCGSVTDAALPIRTNCLTSSEPTRGRPRIPSCVHTHTHTHTPAL